MFRLPICILVLILSLPSGTFAQISESDSLALVELYVSTDGQNWTNNENWLTGPVETWFGVTVSNDRVTKLELYNNNLTGEFPESVTNLDAVTWVDLSSNSLSGQLPESISNMGSLKIFSVKSNALSGTVPLGIGNLTNLTHLYIYNNQFEGTIPDTIRNLHNLLNLEVQINNFSGPFPDVLLELPSISNLNIGRNDFYGPIPKEINSKVTLVVFEAGYCNFSGPLPALTNLTNIRVLSLYGQELTGDLDTVLGYHPELIRINVNANALTGTITAEHFNPEVFIRGSYASNAFTEIDGFTAFKDDGGILEYFNIRSNFLDFDDLSPLEELNIGTFYYEPQYLVGESDSVFLEYGESYTMTSPMENPEVQYQWYLNGEEIPNATDASYTVEAFDAEDEGAYNFVSTHQGFPGLLIESRKTHLISSSVGAQELDQQSWKLYPNPASSQLTLELPSAISKAGLNILSMAGEVVLSLQVLDGNQVSLEGLPPGFYIVRITTEDMSGMKLLVISQ